MNTYEKQKHHKAKSRAKRKAFLDEIRNVPCTDCGGTFPPVCMDFDHMPGHIKSFGIMNQYDYSMKRILEEISKCEIVCANCHRIRTFTRRAVQ